MIPKRVFYVWGENDAPKPDMWLNIQTWRDKLPEYEIIEINEGSTQYFNFKKELEENSWFREVYNRKMWAYVSDYVRIKTLYENGGIYFDTDVCVLKNLDEFLSEPAFVGIQGNSTDTTYDWVEPAILGSKKGNPLLEKILKFYDSKIWTEPIYMMPQIFQYFLKKEYSIDKFPAKDKQEIIKLPEITIYPEKYFIPYRLNQKFNTNCIEPETHTIHFWNGSWNTPRRRFFLKNKHRMPLWFIDFIINLKALIKKRYREG